MSNFFTNSYETIYDQILGSHHKNNMAVVHNYALVTFDQNLYFDGEAAVYGMADTGYMFIPTG